MVDMFTVLVVFLLQNYNLTGQVIHIPKNVHLPKATSVKELKPAHIVMVADGFIHLDGFKLASVSQLSEEDWLIQPLFEHLRRAFDRDKSDQTKGIRNKMRTAVKEAKRGQPVELEEEYRKVTVQADKKVEFKMIKKIMYTLVEAGAGEINFAVEKTLKKSAATN